MKYTVIFKLSGALANAVAVEWTDLAAPAGSGAGWEPCLRSPNGDWRMSSYGAAAGRAQQWRDPGVFANIGLRYRLAAGGPWSPICASRKAITIVAVIAEPPALMAADWAALDPWDLGQGAVAGTCALSGNAAGAVAVDWSVRDAGDWQPCLALGGARWRLAGTAPGRTSTPIVLRYRLEADGAWSPASADAKILVPAWVPVAPLLLTMPILTGTGRIGSEVTVQTGAWRGDPVPDLTLQWRCGGADIAGATATAYVPGPGDDDKDLTCAVSARNVAGSVLVATAALRVRQVAPVAKGRLFEEIFDQGSGLQTVDAAPDFTGASLRYSVSGAGATIDALSGLVSIPTDVPVSETVVVTAMNSGGATTSAFQVTVEAAVEARPPVPAAADWVLRATRYPDPASATFTGIIDTQASLGPVHDVRWTGVEVSNYATEADLEPHWRPTVALGAGVAQDALAWRFSDTSGTDYIRAAGSTMPRIRFEYRTAADGPWSPYPIEAKALSEPLIAPPVPAAGQGYYFMGFRTPEEVAQGLRGGCQEQYWHGSNRSVSNPSLILAGQDSGGTWLSDDDGKTWKKNQDKGLAGFGMQGVLIDPNDPNIFYAVGEPLFQAAADEVLGGIYKSIDKGRTWTLKKSCSDVHHQRVPAIMAFDPNTSGPSLAIYATVHYEDGPGEVYRSLDRGESWVLRSTIPLTASGSNAQGHVTGVVHHPSTTGTLFLCTQAGLWKSIDGGATWMRMTGSGGLPVAEVLTVAINPGNGNDMYAVANASGAGAGTLWHTSDGATWSQISTPAKLRASKVYVGSANGGGWPAAGSRVIYLVTRGADANGNLRVSLDGGSTWRTAAVSGRPGTTSLWENSLADSTNGSARPELCARVMVHPTVANRAIAHGHAGIFRTDDAVTWRYSGEGFAGLIWIKYLSGIGFTNDPLTFAMGVTDSGYQLTRDGGRSWLQDKVDFTNPKDGKPISGSCHAIAMHPTGNIIVLTQGLAGNGANTFFFRTTSANPGSTDWTNIPGMTGIQPFLHWNRTTPTTIYACGARSTNSGVDWSAYPSAMGSVVAVYPGNENTIYGITRTAGVSVAIRRSTDQGATSALHVTASWDFVADGTFSDLALAIHPSNPDILFARSSTGDLARYNGTSWKTDYGLIARFNAANPEVPGFHGRRVVCIAIDPQDANLGYVTIECAGWNTIYRSMDFQSDSPSWEDVTYGLHRVNTGFKCCVHPQTGDAFFGNGGTGGVRFLKAPAARTRPSLAQNFNLL